MRLAVAGLHRLLECAGVQQLLERPAPGSAIWASRCHAAHHPAALVLGSRVHGHQAIPPGHQAPGADEAIPLAGLELARTSPFLSAPRPSHGAVLPAGRRVGGLDSRVTLASSGPFLLEEEETEMRQGNHT